MTGTMSLSAPLTKETRSMSVRQITTLLAAAALQMGSAAAQTGDLDLSTADVTEINAAIDAGTLSSEQLVRQAIARIKAYEPKLHAIITVNPHALEEARALDAERRRNGRRSGLHGIPVLVKDNINTRDLPTTLGFYELRGAVPRADAAVVTRLRKAGAIILAKTNLSELASGPPLSSLGGQTHNPHNLKLSPAGSSNGTAVGVAAGYAPLGVATDTTGSARWPAATNGIVGFRPTTGVISTAGVQPSSVTLDAVGPMARHVTDAAMLLDILQGFDTRQPKGGDAGQLSDIAPGALKPDALRGARIGFPKHDFSGDDAAIDAVMLAAVEALKRAGAEVVELWMPPGIVQLSGALQGVLVQTESAPGLTAYLQTSFGPGFPHSHAEILALSEKRAAKPVAGATPNPGRLEGYRWEAGAALPSDPVYRAARDQGRAFLAASMQAMVDANQLDAIIYPTQTAPVPKIGENAKRNARGLFGNFGSVLASLAGWPELTVPAGFTPDGFPVGISFLGPAYSDQRLLAYGFAFEQAAPAFRQPVETPSLPGDRISRSARIP